MPAQINQTDRARAYRQIGSRPRLIIAVHGQLRVGHPQAGGYHTAVALNVCSDRHLRTEKDPIWVSLGLFNTARHHVVQHITTCTGICVAAHHCKVHKGFWQRVARIKARVSTVAVGLFGTRVGSQMGTTGTHETAKLCARRQYAIGSKCKAAQCCIEPIINVICSLAAVVADARGPSLPLRPTWFGVGRRYHDIICPVAGGKPKTAINDICQRPRKVAQHIIFGRVNSWIHNRQNTTKCHAGHAVCLDCSFRHTCEA